MGDERLHFSDAAGGYNAMLAAEHVLRYHCVRGLCRGKRVLDVACGEGYGSAMLAEWGASEVVGVDISAEAIAAAQKEFSRPSITFIQGDACRLNDVLGDRPGFDLIVSFETIEHVPDAHGLLAGISRYRALHGSVVISCPNDRVEENDNPFHKRRFTFDEFRALTTAGLGPASGWLLGTPAQGQILYPPGEPRMENKSDSRMRLITECQDLMHAAFIAAQPNVAPDADSCKFYIGYWGGPLGKDVVVSPQSYPAFIEPWRALNWFRKEHERYEEQRIARAQVERQLADLRRRVLVQARTARELQARAETQQQHLERANAELARVQPDLQRWTLFQQSRTYRLMQSYVRGYSLPVIGPVLRLARRMAGMT